MAKPANGKKQKGGKKARKYGRNEKWCQGYRAIGTEDVNRLRRLRRHLRQDRHRNDAQGMARYIELGGKQNF